MSLSRTPHARRAGLQGELRGLRASARLGREVAAEGAQRLLRPRAGIVTVEPLVIGRRLLEAPPRARARGRSLGRLWRRHGTWQGLPVSR